MEKQSKITEKTVLPISLLVIIIGGVVRVESTSFKATANEIKIEKLDEENKKLASVIIEVKTSLARIEGALGVKKDAVQN